MEGHPIDVEVSVAQGLPTFTIVGLPDLSIQEARERVRAAMQSCEEEWPQQRITVNLSPAQLRKAGSGFDLAMALGLLSARGRIAQERLQALCVLGELSLDGTVQRIRGILPSAIAAKRTGARALLVPAGNAREAALVQGVDVFPVRHLSEAVRFLRGECQLDPCTDAVAPESPAHGDLDMSDVRGNEIAKDALKVAAAGGHNVLMVGAPGGGKTMLARRLPTILPPMTEAESFEVTRIYSVAGLLPDDRPLVSTRPFRAPHHTSSTTGLVGGGSGMPHPGEVSLAHRGVLFMDEFGEFRREVLQALRQPMEDGTVTIVRSKWAVTYPARFQLIVASNPCPCGNRGDDVKPCVCSTTSLTSYEEKLAGPVIDRIDIQVEVKRLTRDEIFDATPGPTSADLAAEVARARASQGERFRTHRITSNAEIPPRDIERTCELTSDARSALGLAVDRFALSARATHRLMRVARTIADLEQSDPLTRDHIEHALLYRLDAQG